MKLGFVGTGVITAAMVEGLIHRQDVETIYLSPRNRRIADRLAALDKRIRVAEDNNSVLDRSDIVVLAVRPQIAEEVLKALSFDQRHHVISVMATIDLATLRSTVGEVGRITRAIPLPFVAEKAGMTVLYPPDPLAHDLFMTLGTAIEAAGEAEFDLFATGGALMGTYFQLLHECHDWLSSYGLEESKGRTYLASLFQGLTMAMERSPDRDFLALRDDFSTPHGINEQAARIFASEGGAQAIRRALDAVHQRVCSASKIV